MADVHKYALANTKYYLPLFNQIQYKYKHILLLYTEESTNMLFNLIHKCKNLK